MATRVKIGNANVTLRAASLLGELLLDRVAILAIEGDLPDTSSRESLQRAALALNADVASSMLARSYKRYGRCAWPAFTPDDIARALKLITSIPKRTHNRILT